ncbi:hypothetical protein [Sporofaciens musculi]|nr:hypothetical protein [Sporofaciens musculi]
MRIKDKKVQTSEILFGVCIFMRRPVQMKYAAKAAHGSRGE